MIKQYSKFLILLSLILTLGFFILFLLRDSIGFLFDTILLLSITIILFYLYKKKIYFNKDITIGLSIFLILHFCGHVFFIGTQRLYDSWLIQDALKYDNILHFWAGVMLTIIIYNIILKKTRLKESNTIYFFGIIVLVVCGLGAIHEIIEFAASFIFSIQNEIGGYTNNMIDLVFNLLGALITSTILYVKHKK